eukprot:jgi/Undpi1/11016/HiC_scaffold_30.g13316.m1
MGCFKKKRKHNKHQGGRGGGQHAGQENPQPYVGQQQPYVSHTQPGEEEKTSLSQPMPVVVGVPADKK